MANPEGESVNKPLRLAFDRRLKLEFHGSRITSDAGLLAYRELDDALGLTGMIGDKLVEMRTGKNSQHAMTGLFRQSVFGRLGGYEDVNDADRLGRDPAMRWIVGGRAVARAAASTSQMGRFETEFLATDRNLAALADLSGRWNRPLAQAASVQDDRARYRQQRQPDPWRSGRHSLQRSLRLHLLSPAFRFQSVRRPGAVRLAARQRA